jgi:hypothetical protein
MTVSLLLDPDIAPTSTMPWRWDLRCAIQLQAVTTGSGDTTRRPQIAAKLLRLAGRDDIEVAARHRWRPSAWWPAEMGHEGKGLEPGEQQPVSARDAVSLLLQQTKRAPAGCCRPAKQPSHRHKRLRFETPSHQRGQQPTDLCDGEGSSSATSARSAAPVSATAIALTSVTRMTAMKALANIAKATCRCQAS